MDADTLAVGLALLSGVGGLYYLLFRIYERMGKYELVCNEVFAMTKRVRVLEVRIDRAGIAPVLEEEDASLG